MADRPPFQKKLEKLELRKEELTIKNNEYLRQITALQYNKIDSAERSVTDKVLRLACFWNNSKRYMEPGEASMSIEGWFQFFDTNRPRMESRYNAITLSEECKKMLLEQQQKRIEEQKQRQKLEQNLRLVTQTLKINELGIYNCDQLRRLTRPVTVDAAYKDRSGNTVKPDFIFVIDSEFNGVLRYDGSYGYSPTHFAYSPSSSNTLIAFTEAGDAYIIKAPEFRIATGSTKKKIDLVLTKIQNITGKEQLLALF
ncbi:MAG TPA: hypothetical protein VF676_00095 [Flavobacterium sp.]|jgi:hypothetical protein